MADRPRGRQPIRFENRMGADSRETPRSAPPPRPPIQYTQSGHMKGYEEEIMPPRRMHTPVDNGIEFPAPPRQTPPPGGQRPRQGQRSGSRRPAEKKRGFRRRKQPAGSAPRQAGTGAVRRPARERDPARREGTRKRKVTRAMLRRRRFFRRLTAFFLLAAVIAAGGYLTVTILFKISALEVQSPEGEVLSQAGPYSSGQVLEALGVRLEEIIFSFSSREKEELLEQQLPLLEEIKVIRRYPGTVVVRVTPATPTYTAQTPAGWLTLSANLKILSVGAEQPALPVLWGGDPAAASPGSQLSYLAAAEEDAGAASGSAASEEEAEQTDTRLETLQTLLQILQERGLMAGVTRIEFADPEQLAFLYEDRISVLLGTLNGLEYKMDYAQYLLLNTDGKGCAPTDTGALDCSHLRTDGTLQVIFAQGEPELPSGYLVPEPPAPEQSVELPAEQPAPDAQPQPAGTEAAPEQPAAGQAPEQTEINQ